MNNIINIPYGDDTLEIDVNNINIQQVITPKDVSLPDNRELEIQNALNNPIGCGKISDIVAYETKNSKEVESPEELDLVIISDDNTRLTPSNLILPPILKEMETAGISRDNIKIVMALGTHRDMTKEEMIDKVGKEIYKNYKIVNHNYYNQNELVDLGTTEYGTPIMINKDVYEADIVLGIGSIVPHHIPGFSGGAKIIQPGVSGSLTTAYTHLLSVRKRRSFLGYIENPVREEMEVIARKVGANYIFNTVLSRKGDLYKCFFGDVAEAFRKGVEAAQEVYEVEVDSTSPVTLAGSFPCNIEFWQAHKSLYPGDMITKDDGMLIILTPAYEGVSVTHNGMLDFTSLSPEKINKMVDNDEIEDKVAAALAMAWSKITDRLDVVLVSEGIDQETASALNFKYADSIAEALKMAEEKYGENFTMNVLTHAPDTLPIISGK